MEITFEMASAIRILLPRRGGVEDDVSWRVGEARKAADTVKNLWKNGCLGMNAN